MPTFSRLVAAILLAALGAYVGTLTGPYLPERTPYGKIVLVAAASGVLVGWFFTGGRLQRGVAGPVAIGLTSVVVQAILTIGVFSVNLMLKRAFRNAYNTVMEAVVGVFQAGIEYGEMIGQPDIIVTTALGGVAIGAITGWVARRTR